MRPIFTARGAILHRIMTPQKTARYIWVNFARQILARALKIFLALLVTASTLSGFTAGLCGSRRSPANAASYQDWPMFLQNPQRTDATIDPKLSVGTAGTLKERFAFAAGGPIATSTSIVGTTAYVGSWDGYEYAVNTQTGAQIWKQFLGITTDPGCNPSDGVTSSAAVVNGVLYVGGGGPYWYALDPATGNILWKVYTGDNSQAGAHYNWSSPLIVGNYAYIGIASNCDNPLVQGQLLEVAISGPQQGQIVNTYDFVPNGEVGGGIWTSPTYDPATNTIFVSTGTLNDHTQTQSQAIVALNATTLQYGAPGSCRSRHRFSTPTGGRHPPSPPTRPGPAAVGRQQERHPVHLQPQQPVRGAGLARPDRHRRRLPDLRRRNHRVGHLRQRHAVLRGGRNVRRPRDGEGRSPRSVQAPARWNGAARRRARSWARRPT